MLAKMRVYLVLVFCVVLWCNRVVETRHHRHKHYRSSLDIATSSRQYDPNLEINPISDASTKRPVNIYTNNGNMNNISPVDSGYFNRPEVVSPPRRYFPKDSVVHKPIRQPTTTIFPNIERLIATRLKMAAYRRTSPLERYKPTKGLEENNMDMIPTIAEPMRENLDKTNTSTNSGSNTTNKKGERRILTTMKPNSGGQDQNQIPKRENIKWPPDTNVYPVKKASGEIISSIVSAHVQSENNENTLDWHNLEEINNSNHKDSWGPNYSVSELKPSRRPSHHSPHRHRRKKHSHRRSSNKSKKNKKKKSRKHKKSKNKKSSDYGHYKDSSDYHHFGHYENNRFYPANIGTNNHRHNFPQKGYHKHTMSNTDRPNRGHDEGEHRPGHHDTELDSNSQPPLNGEIDQNQPQPVTDNHESQHSEENQDDNHLNVSNSGPNNQMHSGEKPTEHSTPDDYQSGEGPVKPTASTGDMHEATNAFSEETESNHLYYTSGEEAHQEQELPSDSGEYTDNGDGTDHEENNGEYLSTEQHSGEMQETGNLHTEEEYMEEYDDDDNGEQYPSFSSHNDDNGSEGNTDDWNPYRGESPQVHSNHSSTENANPQTGQSSLAQTVSGLHQPKPQPEEVDPNVAPSSQEMATPLNSGPPAANIPQVPASTGSLHKPLIVTVTRPPYIPSGPDSYEDYEEDDDGDDDEGYDEDEDDDDYPSAAPYPYSADDDDEGDDYDGEYYGATAPGHYSSSYDPYSDDDYPSSLYNDSDYDSEYKSDPSRKERTDQAVKKSKRRSRSTLRKRKRRTSINLRTIKAPLVG